MSAISLKSITGITSITTPAGVDNQLTLHNNNTSEAVKLDIAGNVHINNQLAVAGVSTFSSNVTISKQNAVIELSDPDSSDANYQIRNDNGTFDIKDSTNSTVKIRAASSYVTVFPNLNANNGLDVMGTITGDGNLDIADSIRHSGDVNTKITFPANDTISFDTAGSERLRIKSDGNVGIGTDDPEGKLHIYSNNPSIKLTDFNQAADNTNWHISAGNTKILRIQALTDAGVGGGGLFDFYRNNQNIDEFRGMQGGNYWFVINNPNRRVGIGTDDPKRLLHLQSTGDALARITSADGYAAYLELGDVSDPDGGKIVYDSGSNLEFYTASSARLRIQSDGDIRFQNYGTLFGNTGLTISNTTSGGPQLLISRQAGNPLLLNRNSDGQIVELRRGWGAGGSIDVGVNSATYNTSSDYRLKENIVPISDGITRLKTLKPSRFNWKGDTSSTRDGFIAHEVTAVPEAITGTKDEVYSEDEPSINVKAGDPKYQGIDQSKLVPLLVAALQEAIARIEALEGS